MNPRVVEIKPNPDYSLTLKFTNGEVRRFDVRPYLEKGIFGGIERSTTVQFR
jgi:hypothetical protein